MLINITLVIILIIYYLIFIFIWVKGTQERSLVMLFVGAIFTLALIGLVIAFIQKFSWDSEKRSVENEEKQKQTTDEIQGKFKK